MDAKTITTIIECVATVISIFIAVIALIQSHNQTRLSNKQNLFKERIKNYLIINGLIELYNRNKQSIEEKKKDEIYFTCDFMLGCLINNSYLEIMGEAINKPLHQSEQKEFLRKIEELQNEAEKTKFIFDEKIANDVNKFINAYADLLMGLYKYVVLIDSMRKIQEQIPQKQDIHEVAKEVNEEEYRKELFNKFENLINAFNGLEKNNIMKKLSKQIKLK